MPRYFWFSYPPKQGAWRSPASKLPFTIFDLHRSRDADMFLALSSCLGPAWKYAGRIFNPPAGLHAPASRQKTLRPTGCDLLLLPTRPPISDNHNTQHKTIMRSNSALERQMLAALGQLFERMDRYDVDLANDVKQHLPKSSQRLASVSFVTKEAALEKGTGRSYVYLFSLPPGTAGLEPRLLSGFGMGGYETMLFAESIRRDEDWRRTARWMVRSDYPCLVIGEMGANYSQVEELPEMPPQVTVTERIRVVLRKPP